MQRSWRLVFLGVASAVSLVTFGPAPLFVRLLLVLFYLAILQSAFRALVAGAEALVQQFGFGVLVAALQGVILQFAYASFALVLLLAASLFNPEEPFGWVWFGQRALVLVCGAMGVALMGSDLSPSSPMEVCG